MKRCLLLLAACWLVQGEAQAHDIITTAITFDRDISRIVNTHCASCHHPGGMAFSLMTYADARPWAVAIKEEILRRRMPPWGAIKGFGEFRNDQALTPEEMERIVSWTDGGVPEGEPKDMPPPPKSLDPETFTHHKGELSASGDFALPNRSHWTGFGPRRCPRKARSRSPLSFPTAASALTLAAGLQAQFGHPFLFQTPLNLPARTVLRGIPPGAKIALLAGEVGPAIFHRIPQAGYDRLDI